MRDTQLHLERFDQVLEAAILTRVSKNFRNYGTRRRTIDGEGCQGNVGTAVIVWNYEDAGIRYFEDHRGTGPNARHLDGLGGARLPAPGPRLPVRS